MPELRSIRWDHNGFVGNHLEVDLYAPPELAIELKAARAANERQP